MEIHGHRARNIAHDERTKRYGSILMHEYEAKVNIHHVVMKLGPSRSNSAFHTTKISI